MNPRTFFASIFLSLAILGGFTAAAETPEEVATRSFEALMKDDYKGFCDCFSDNAVKEVADFVDFALDEGEQGEQFLAELFGGAAKEDLKKLSPIEKFTGIIRFVMQAMKEDADVAISDVKILGSVPENENLHHVVVRVSTKLNDTVINGIDVASFEKGEDGEWGMLMKADMEAFLTAVRGMLEQE
jgi:hypothetical protein